MTERNPLVDKGAKTTWEGYAEEYSPIKRDENGNIVANGVPGITYGPGGTAERPKWSSGIPVTSSVELLGIDIADGKYFDATFDALAVLADSAAVGATIAGVETLGGAVSAIAQPLIAWIMDHVQPIRLVLDLLVGNPGTIAGVSKTWTNMGEALGAAAKDFHTAATATGDYWTGAAGDAYRTPYAHDLAKHTNDLGLLCEVWAAVTQIVGDLVLVAHNLVRDLLSTLIAALIEIAIDAMAYPPPVNVGVLAKDGAVEVTKITAFVAKALIKTAEGFAAATTVAGLVLTEIRRILTAIKYLVELANRGGDAAPAAAT